MTTDLVLGRSPCRDPSYPLHSLPLGFCASEGLTEEAKNQEQRGLIRWTTGEAPTLASDKHSSDPLTLHPDKGGDGSVGQKDSLPSLPASSAVALPPIGNLPGSCEKVYSCNHSANIVCILSGETRHTPAKLG